MPFLLLFYSGHAARTRTKSGKAERLPNFSHYLCRAEGRHPGSPVQDGNNDTDHAIPAPRHSGHVAHHAGAEILQRQKDLYSAGHHDELRLRPHHRPLLRRTVSRGSGRGRFRRKRLVVPGPDNRSALLRLDGPHGRLYPTGRRIHHHHGLTHIGDTADCLGRPFPRRTHHRLGTSRHGPRNARLRIHHLPSARQGAGYGNGQKRTAQDRSAAGRRIPLRGLHCGMHENISTPHQDRRVLRNGLSRIRNHALLRRLFRGRRLLCRERGTRGIPIPLEKHSRRSLPGYLQLFRDIRSDARTTLVGIAAFGEKLDGRKTVGMLFAVASIFVLGFLGGSL